jgi:CrcB protein
VAYAWVGIGGLVGATARFAVYQLMVPRLGAGFPYATFLVNASGSLLIGVLVTWLTARAIDPAWRLMLVTGFLGGYTTFSAFSHETVSLLLDQQWERATLYVVASNVVGVAACWIGMGLTRAVLGALV